MSSSEADAEVVATAAGPGPRSAVLDRLVVKLVYYWAGHPHSRLAEGARFLLKAFGVDWRPQSVGPGLRMPHATTGSVVHRATRIGSDVTVFHGVTIGRSDPHQGHVVVPGVVEGVRVGDRAVLGANAIVLFKAGQVLEIGAGCVVGAGAVLLRSTGDGEVWAGNPAVRVRGSGTV